MITRSMFIDGNLVTLYRSNGKFMIIIYFFFLLLSKCCVNRSCDILEREDGGQRTCQPVCLFVCLSNSVNSLPFLVLCGEENFY